MYKRQIANCIIERNRGDGILGLAAVDSVFSRNVVRNNGAKGVTLRAGSRNVRLVGNEFKGNRGDGKAQVKVSDDSVSVGIEASNRFE